MGVVGREMRVAVGGAGISGVATALQLLRSAPSDVHVCLIDQSSRVGGYLQTHRDNSGGYWEVGPRSIRVTGGDQTLALLQSLDLTPLPAESTSKERYLYYAVDDHTSPTMHAMPSGLATWPSRLPSLPWQEMIKTQVRSKSRCEFFRICTHEGTVDSLIRFNKAGRGKQVTTPPTKFLCINFWNIN